MSKAVASYRKRFYWTEIKLEKPQIGAAKLMMVAVKETVMKTRESDSDS